MAVSGTIEALLAQSDEDGRRLFGLASATLDVVQVPASGVATNTVIAINGPMACTVNGQSRAIVLVSPTDRYYAALLFNVEIIGGASLYFTINHEGYMLYDGFGPATVDIFNFLTAGRRMEILIVNRDIAPHSATIRFSFLTSQTDKDLDQLLDILRKQAISVVKILGVPIAEVGEE